MAVIFTGVALICIVAIQLIWLHQSYKLNYELFDKYVNKALVESIDEEFNLRTKSSYKHIVFTKEDGEEPDNHMIDSLYTEKGLGEMPDNVSTLDYPDVGQADLQSKLRSALNFMLPPDINVIDSLFSLKIKLEYPNEETFIELTSLDSDTIIKSTSQGKVNGRYYATHIAVLDDYSKQAVRGIVISPEYFGQFSHTTGAMILSILFVIMAVSCTLYVIQVVFKQNKYTQSVTDYTHYTVHQMQTPIMLATMSLKRLQSQSNENAQQVKPYIDISEKNLKKLSSLSDSLLYMAVQERSTMQVTKEPFDLVAVIKAMRDEYLMKQQVDKKVSIEIENQLDDPVIMADHLHLCNALSNLIDNALKYSRESVDIRIKLESTVSGIRISVKDNGLGVDKEHINHIFDRFYRVIDPDKGQQTKGFGLGLSYVRVVCEAHGGSIHVRSTLGEGSEFIIELPVKE